MNLKVQEMMVCVHTIDGSTKDAESIPAPDIRSSKPYGMHDQKNGNTLFFQKVITTKLGNSEISIAIPNEIALSLSISKKTLLAAESKRMEIKHSLKNSAVIFDSDVKIAYDFLEEIQQSVVFSYKAIESFCNATITDEYTYKKTTNKGIVEHYGKEQIERWISTSEKAAEIIPDILKCKSPSAQKFWPDFKQLERIRNEIIHSKSSNSKEILSELFSEKIKAYILSSTLLLEFFIKLDPCNPIFPLGFGESTVKAESVPDTAEYLAIIRRASDN